MSQIFLEDSELYSIVVYIKEHTAKHFFPMCYQSYITSMNTG